MKVSKFFALVLLCLFSSCASILSSSKYSLAINSTPEDASIVITDKKGEEVFKGKTPASVILKSGKGYFSKAKYQISFSKEGYNDTTIPLEATLDGWYIGNILFGGLVGILIVDPLTGAMYKLDETTINQVLESHSLGMEDSQIKVFDYSDIPLEWKGNLVEIGEKP